MSANPTPWRLQWNITQPGQLEDVIAIVSKAVERGELREVTRPVVAAPQQPSIAELERSGQWPDVIDLLFEEASTGRRFRLVCETYHGSGGSWGPWEGDEDS